MNREPMDPEVRADIEKRDRIAASRAPAPLSLYDQAGAKARPSFVGAWKCRGCTALVPVQECDLEYLAMWNGVLRAQGAEPIDHNRVVFCDGCRAKGKAMAAERRREEVDRLAELIRELKAAPDPDREQATIRRLRDLGHPDVDGLLHVLRERAGKTTAKGRGKGTM